MEVIVTIVIVSWFISPIYLTYPTYLYRGEIIHLLSTSRTSEYWLAYEFLRHKVDDLIRMKATAKQIQENTKKIKYDKI